MDGGIAALSLVVAVLGDAKDPASGRSAVIRYHADMSESIRRMSTSSGSTLISSPSFSAFSPMGRSHFGPASVSPLSLVQGECGQEHQCIQQQELQTYSAQYYTIPDLFAQTPSPSTPGSNFSAGTETFSTYTPPGMSLQQHRHTFTGYFHIPNTARYSCTFADCTWATDHCQLLQQHHEEHTRLKAHHCFIQGCFSHFSSDQDLHLHLQNEHSATHLLEYGYTGTDLCASALSTSQSTNVQSYFDPQGQAIPCLISKQKKQVVGLGLVQAEHNDQQSTVHCANEQSQVDQYSHSQQRHTSQVPSLCYPCKQLQQLRLAGSPGQCYPGGHTDITAGHTIDSPGGTTLSVSSLQDHAEEAEVYRYQMPTALTSVFQPSILHQGLSSFSSETEGNIQHLAVTDIATANPEISSMGEQGNHFRLSGAGFCASSYAPGTTSSSSSGVSELTYSQVAVLCSFPVQAPWSTPARALSSMDASTSSFLASNEEFWHAACVGLGNTQHNKTALPSSLGNSQSSESFSSLAEPLELRTRQMMPTPHESDLMFDSHSKNGEGDVYRAKSPELELWSEPRLDVPQPSTTVAPLEYIGVPNHSALCHPEPAAFIPTAGVIAMLDTSGSTGVYCSSPPSADIPAWRSAPCDTNNGMITEIPRKGSDASYLAGRCILPDARGSSASPFHIKQRIAFSPEMLAGESVTLAPCFPHVQTQVTHVINAGGGRLAASAGLYDVTDAGLNGAYLSDEAGASLEENDESADVTFEPLPSLVAAVKRRAPNPRHKATNAAGKPLDPPGPRAYPPLSVNLQLVPNTSTFASSDREGFGESPVTIMVNGRRKKDGIPLTAEEKAKMYACSYANCDRAFKRLEHRRRHERSHTQERPYQCDIDGCRRFFSRRDNLKQHKLTHYKPGGRNSRATQETSE